MPMSRGRLLRIKDLLLHFRMAQGAVQAVDGMNLELDYPLIKKDLDVGFILCPLLIWSGAAPVGRGQYFPS